MFSSVRPTPLGANLTPVYLDQYTGALLAEAAPSRRTAGDVIMAWVAPLHVGNFARQRRAGLVARARPGTAGALRDRLHHVVDAVVRPRWLRVSTRGSDLGFER